MTTQACKLIQTSQLGQLTSNLAMPFVVPSGQEKILITRIERTSLCRNTGVLATMLVNGEIASQGVLESETNSIQCNAQPGDIVVAVVSLYPLMNSTVCSQLGDASITLSQCDAVVVPTEFTTPESISSSDWNSSCNKKPPAPDEFHVSGTVELPNASWSAKLVPSVPQGINQEILFLDLILTRNTDPISRPQVVVKQPVLYSRSINDCPYSKVVVYYNKTSIADLSVKETL
jgi:hypothetical protein